MTTQHLSPLTMLLSRHTRRREFIALHSGVATWPLAARAQPVIGLLSGIEVDDRQFGAVPESQYNLQSKIKGGNTYGVARQLSSSRHPRDGGLSSSLRRYSAEGDREFSHWRS